MKGTSIFNKSPWSKLHLPLPRTPRQSQQLLNALTSSFRRQLDREYPSSAPLSEEQRPGDHEDDVGNRLTHNPHSSAHATDNHLRAILENPLFSVVPSRSSIPRGSPALDSIERQRWAKEPMAVLDELVASGSVTPSALNTCLKSQLLLTSPHTGEGFVKALRDSRAGSKVVSWWFASDSETRKVLFESPGATASLLKFMVAEGLYDAVFSWLKMLSRCDLGGNDGRIAETHAQQMFRSLLIYFLEAESQYGGGLSSAMRYYLQVCKTQMSAGSELLSLPRKPTLRPSGARLCQWVQRNTYGYAKDIPATMYDEFLGVVSTLAPKSILSASAPLYHPTKPDAKPFVTFVGRISPDSFESWSEKKREGFMRTSFDALRILVDQGNVKDCSYLARFMQQKLNEKAEARSSSQSGYHASREEEEDLLIRLDLALT